MIPASIGRLIFIKEERDTMANFTFGNKWKYDEEWEWTETLAWMEEAQLACKNEFDKVLQDYQIYQRAEFAALEIRIATEIFPITEEFAEKAYKGHSILRYFKKHERKMAVKARKKMEKISGGDTVEMQIIPIAVRMDKDLKRNSSDTEKERNEKEKNKNTGRIFVFRVKAKDGSPRFLDCEFRTYETWESYLDKNNAPQCIMCYPVDGFLLKQDANERFVANDLVFGTPPSCRLHNRLKSACDTVVMYASPIIAIAGIALPFLAGYIPVTWTRTAALMAKACALASVTATGLLYYGLATTAISTYDQFMYGDTYGSSLLTFIASIESMIKALPTYLRGVASTAQYLTTLESLVINCFLIGLKTSQVISFVWMMLNLATKPKLTPMDIVSFVVAVHNVYSCVMSPWMASRLITKVQAEMQAEHMKKIAEVKKALEKEQAKLTANLTELEELNRSGAATPTIAEKQEAIREGKERIKEFETTIQTEQTTFHNNEEKWKMSDLYHTNKNREQVNKEKINIEVNEARLRKLRREGADPNIIAEIERTIQKAQEKVENLEASILKDQDAFIAKEGEKIKDENAKRGYNKFLTDSKEGLERNSQIIDQNGKLCKAVVYMDAEMVFKMVSITGSKIQFANGETLDLLVNSQLEIHPRAINQMNRINKETKKNGLQDMMKVTKKWIDSRNPNTAVTMTEDEYLSAIKPCLKLYQMITQTEIQKVQEDILSKTDEGPLRNRLVNLKPDEAFRMRIVLTETNENTLRLANKFAQAYDQENCPSIYTLATWVEIVKLANAEYEPPPVPEDTRERRFEFFERLKNEETEKLQGEKYGKTSGEAEEMANQNLKKRQNVINAVYAYKEGQITEQEKNNIIKDNVIKEESDYKKDKFYEYNRFEDWNAGGTKDERKGDYIFAEI